MEHSEHFTVKQWELDVVHNGRGGIKAMNLIYEDNVRKALNNPDYLIQIPMVYGWGDLKQLQKLLKEAKVEDRWV